MKTIQYFTKEYLQQCQSMSPLQIVQFLENFRQLQAPPNKSKLISIKIPENLLTAFKQKAKLEKVKYQTQIKELMKGWLEN